jgi:hypothetical protein
MKHILCAALLCLSLSSCLFKEPLFTSGYAPVDSSLIGVWMTEGDGKDPREREFAVVAGMGADTLMLHYPVGQKGGNYFEARPLKVRGRDLWQLRLATTFDDGVPDKDTPTYTLIWIEKKGDGQFSVRHLSSEGPHTASAAEARKALESDKSDWEKLFGEALLFTRLNEQR